MYAISRQATTPRSTLPTVLYHAFYATTEDLSSRDIWNIISRWRKLSGVYRDGKGNACVRAAVSKLRVTKTTTVEFLGNTHVLENAYRKDELHAETIGKCESYGEEAHGKNSLGEFYEKCTAAWLAIEVENLMRRV